MAYQYWLISITCELPAQKSDLQDSAFQFCRFPFLLPLPTHFTEMPNFSAAATSGKKFRGMTEASGGENFATLGHYGAHSVSFSK
jgi:hypothetical protein